MEMESENQHLEFGSPINHILPPSYMEIFGNACNLSAQRGEQNTPNVNSDCIQRGVLPSYEEATKCDDHQESST